MYVYQLFANKEINGKTVQLYIYFLYLTKLTFSQDRRLTVYILHYYLPLLVNKDSQLARDDWSQKCASAFCGDFLIVCHHQRRMVCLMFVVLLLLLRGIIFRPTNDITI